MRVHAVSEPVAHLIRVEDGRQTEESEDLRAFMGVVRGVILGSSVWMGLIAAGALVLSR